MTFGGHLTRIPRAGRNDPCPCGSGKKYKKCCLDKDLETGREAREALPEVMAKFAEQAARHERTERILREQYGKGLSGHGDVAARTGCSVFWTVRCQ